MKPNCLKCKYFSITWETEHPRACAVFGFKSKTMPSERVLEITGEECPMFEEKPISIQLKDQTNEQSNNMPHITQRKIDKKA